MTCVQRPRREYTASRGLVPRGATLAVDHLPVPSFIVVLVAFVIGFVLGRYRTHIFQNRGEAIVSRALQSRFAPPNYHLLNHVTLRLKEGTTCRIAVILWKWCSMETQIARLVAVPARNTVHHTVNIA